MEYFLSPSKPCETCGGYPNGCNHGAEIVSANCMPKCSCQPKSERLLDRNHPTIKDGMDRLATETFTPTKVRCEKCHCKHETHDEHKTHPECFTSRAEGWLEAFEHNSMGRGWFTTPDSRKECWTYIRQLLLSSRQSAIEECEKAVNVEAQEWADIGLPMDRDSFSKGGDWAIYREGAMHMAQRNYHALRLLRKESEDKKGV